MSRENNGVRSKVTENSGAGDNERGQGPAGRNTGNSLNGGEAAYCKRLGTEKDNGGVGGENRHTASDKDMGGIGDNKGSNGPANDFRGTH